MRLRPVVLFSEAGGLYVISFSVIASFVGLRVHGIPNSTDDWPERNKKNRQCGALDVVSDRKALKSYF